MITNLIEKHITVPLFQTQIDEATKFARQNATPESKEKVFLNTLAVYAVNTYLKNGDIQTNLNENSSWHPLDRAFFDVSDLYISNLGVTIECCPIKPKEKIVNLTNNPLNKPILGYVAVQFLDTLDEVRLIGYLSAAKIAEDLFQLPIAEFGEVSNIFDDFFYLEESVIALKDQINQTDNQSLKEILEIQFLHNDQNNIAVTILEFEKKREQKKLFDLKIELARKTLEFTEKKELESLTKAEDEILLSVKVKDDDTILAIVDKTDIIELRMNLEEWFIDLFDVFDGIRD